MFPNRRFQWSVFHFRAIVLLLVVVATVAILWCNHLTNFGQQQRSLNALDGVVQLFNRKPNFEDDGVCNTHDCQETANTFLQSMNFSIDPCHDFFQFACGRDMVDWSAHDKAIKDKDFLFMPKVISLSRGQIKRRDKLVIKLIGLVESINESDIQALQELKTFYESCINFPSDPMDSSRWSEAFPISILTGRYDKIIGATTSQIQNRSTECILFVEKQMTFAVTYIYALECAKNDKNDEARELLTFISKSYQNLMLELTWMDNSTKEGLRTSLTSMRAILGYPDWVRNSSIVNGYYEGLQFSNESLANNIYNLLKWDTATMSKRLELLRLNGVELGFLGWSAFEQDSPLAAVSRNTGQYDREKNQVDISAGYLQKPYFCTGLRAADYGALGYVIGHELAHQLTPSVLKEIFNVTSEETNDRSDLRKSLMKFRRRTICLKNKFESYWSTAAVETTGDRRLEEDIADDGGIRIAYNAYKLYLAKRGKPEPRLPGRENYTPEQIFFLSYGQKFCASNIKLPDNFKYATHSPAEYRVFAPLSNFDEFSKAWQCSKGSRMNPEKKCDLWQ